MNNEIVNTSCCLRFVE